MKIQTTISGTVAPILSPKKKKQLKKNILSKMETLAGNLVNEKQPNIKKKLNMMAKASGRKKYNVKKSPRTPAQFETSETFGAGLSPLPDSQKKQFKKMSLTTQVFNVNDNKISKAEDSEYQIQNEVSETSPAKISLKINKKSNFEMQNKEEAKDIDQSESADISSSSI
jgi:hypothetical protein